MTFVVKAASQKTKPLKAKIFLQDPFVAGIEESIGIHEIEMSAPEAVLGPGPSTSRIVVVDYNADLDVVLEPAAPLVSETGFNVGRTNELENAKFHQVNAWAVVNRTLQLLEGDRVLGRRVPWAFAGGRITIIPHAGYWENAYYDRSTGALHFFYFEGVDGSPVFTCLSHDIITHELGHAVLDGLKPYYNEISSPATSGFHEFFGDAIAIATKLTHRPIAALVAGRQDAVTSTSVITNIAAGFGANLSANYGSLANAYLRSAANNKKMKDVEHLYQEHLYSEVLTGAYYSFLKKAYATRLKAAIADPDRPNDAPGQQRVRALISAADVTSRMLIRAIDYCPPVDIRFIDFAKAAVRSDEMAYPVDVGNHRKDLVKIFVDRGIAKSEGDLTADFELRNNDLRHLDVERLSASKTDAYDFVNANRDALQVPPEANLEVINVYRTNKVSSSGYRPPREIIVEFVWAEDVTLSGDGYGRFRGSVVPLWCGGTLVFSRDGNVLHYAVKLGTKERRSELRKYVKHLITTRAISMPTGESGFGSAGTGGSVEGHLDGRKLRLTKSAAFRHSGRGQL